MAIKGMKKKRSIMHRVVWGTVMIIVLIISVQYALAEAVRDDLPIHIRSVTGAGVIQAGTFNYTINISSASNCSETVHSNNSLITTDSSGVATTYLKNLSVNFSEQYWLCYSKDGVRQDPVQIGRSAFSFRTKFPTNLSEFTDDIAATGNTSLQSNLTALQNNITTEWDRITNNTQLTEQEVQDYIFDTDNSVTGGTTITSTYAGNTLKIDQNADAGASTSTGGALLIDNTGNVGSALTVYSSNGATQNGHLINSRVNNAAFDKNAIYALSNGATNTVFFQYTGSGSAGALSVTSNNDAFSAMQLSGNESNKGTLKITHNQPSASDADAAALSIDLKGLSTVARGIFIDSTDGGSTGDLASWRNNGVEQFVVESDGTTYVYSSINADDWTNVTITESQISDLQVYFANLSNFTGTLTDTYLCVYDLANNELDCNTDPSSIGGNSSWNESYARMEFDTRYSYKNLTTNISNEWDRLVNNLTLQVDFVALWANYTTHFTNYTLEWDRLINNTYNLSWTEGTARTNFDTRYQYSNASVGGSNSSTEFGIIRGFTSTFFSGNLSNGTHIGYVRGDAECSVEYPGSHFCLEVEVMKHNELFPDDGFTGQYWTKKGAPGFTANANDCEGWTKIIEEIGPFWDYNENDGVGAGKLTPCASTLQLACCGGP